MAPGSKFSFEGNSGGSSGPSEATRGEPGTNGSNATSEGIGGPSGIAPESAAGPVRKRRGRPALPRDANGNIVRDGTQASGGTGKETKSSKLDLGKFRPNDRHGVRQQIQGMHAAVATLTRQPIFLLNDLESESLTKSLCDVLDYHEINLTEAGGAGALYLALGLTVFGIYKPRIDALKRGGGAEITQRATSPSTRMEAKTNHKDGPIFDFSMDRTGAPDAESVAH